MKPIVIIGGKEKAFSAEELKKYVEEAYSQGYEDGYKNGKEFSGITYRGLTNAPDKDNTPFPFLDSTKITCQTVL
nr:MAG TPA: contact dependent inhibitor A [Caudoviricetes sp.]